MAHHQPGGTGPLAICDRCGLTYRLNQLSREWTGLMVCSKDRDPRPAQLTPPVIGPEGVPLRNARPEPAPIFRDPNAPIDWNSL